jgi:multidrug transporter EmrE-like cation transporter
MFYLAVTIIADVIGVALLGKAKGLSEPWYLAAGVVCMIVGFIAFSFATKSLSVGFANAAWSGLSIVLVLLVGKLFFGEEISLPQYFFILMILMGVIGLQSMEKA